MEPDEFLYCKNIIKLIKDFAKKSFDLELELNNTDNDINRIESELNLLSNKITVTKKEKAENIKFQINESVENISQNELVKNLIDAAPDGMVAINEQGFIVLFNKQAELQFGYTSEEIVGERIEKLMPKKYEDIHKHHTTDYFKNPKQRAMGLSNNELWGRKKNGTIFPIEISLSYLHASTGMLAISAIRDVTEKRMFCEDLIKSERKLREITASVNGIVYQYKYNADGSIDFDFVSDGSKALWGIYPEEVYKDGRLPFSKIHPDDWIVTKAAIDESNANGTNLFHIFRIICDDGTIKWMQSNGIARKEIDGTIIRTGCIIDITQSKIAENKLIESEAFYISILASLSSQIAILDNDGTIIATNKAWDEYSIYNNEIILPRIAKGTNYFDLCKNAAGNGENTASRVLEAIYNVLHNRSQLIEINYSFELNGEDKWFMLRILPLNDINPKIILAHHNITEIKQTERELIINKEKYQTILETTDEMINTVSPDGKIIWANKAWKQNLLYNDNELKELMIYDLNSPKSKIGFNERLNKIKIGETLRNISITLINKEGSEVDVFGTIVPIIEDGVHKGTQAFLRNITEINKERNERIKAETRLQRTLDGMNIGCMVVGFDWKYLYVNEAAASQAFQLSVNLIGKTMQQMYPGVEDTIVFSKYKECMEKRTHFEFEEKYIFTNGNTKWFEFKVEPVDEGIFILTMDITEKKAIEENLRRNKELLTESQRIAQLGSWELDLINNTLQWSDEIYRIFEIDKLRFGASYEAFLDLVHPEDKDYVNIEYTNSVNNKTPYNIIHRLLLKDGRLKYVHEQAETFYDIDGIPIRSVGSVHDITQQKQAELLSQQNERKYRQVVENISDAILIDDKEGKMVYVNDQFINIFGFNDNELTNLSIKDYVAPQYLELMQDRHNRRIAGENVIDFFEYEGIRKNGEKLWLEVRVCKIIENNEIIGTQSAIRNVTERKLAEQKLELQNTELKKINAELDRFVYSTSHELRAPLLSLLGLIDLCHTSQELTELNTYLQLMTTSVGRIDETIKEILAYSKNSRMNLFIEHLDMKLITKQLFDSIKDLKGVDKINFTVDINDSIPFYSDKIRMVTILSNLLSNAITYMRTAEKQPAINISFFSTINEGFITIEDNGEGIEHNKTEKIFEMFYRNSEKSFGSGLGLYICKEIVNKLGGLITVISEIGKGSTFIIQLPNFKDKI